MHWLKSVKVVEESPELFNSKCLIIPVSASSELPPLLSELDEYHGNILAKAYAKKFINDKKGQVSVLFSPVSEGMTIIIAGIGRPETAGLAGLRTALANAVQEMKKLKLSSAVVLDTFSESLNLKLTRIAKYTAISLVSASYEFYEYNRSKRAEEHLISDISIAISKYPEQWQDGIRQGLAIAEGICLVRDLGFHPGNVATPAFLAEAAKEIAKSDNMSVQIFGRKEIDRMGMGGLTAVSSGSHEEPKFILMQYQGADKNDKPVALVGKGLTFDTGGISLKPGLNMDHMKYDMLGGAAVLGIMKAVSILQPQINIVAAVPSCDNMPDGASVRPGDIITAYNKLTIEVLNTDAEGRLILADALAYVSEQYQPRLIFDFATLTGAVLFALGHEASAILGNDEEIIAKLKKAGDTSGERVWQLPLYPEFTEMIKSDIADVKNIGPAKQAGTAVAAAFLKEFVGENIPWVHFDIAGTGWLDKKSPLGPKGPSGVGPALIMEFLSEF